MEFIAYAQTMIHKLPLIITGLIGIGTVMAFHELGHFLFGKLFNVHIPNFSVGMGPKLLSKQIGETTFSLSLIPVGAYVEANDNPQTAGSKDRTISAKSYWQKMAIVSGGILFNLIFAYSILVGLSTKGIPANPIIAHNSTYSVEKVIPDSAAQKGGLLPGDKILAINGKEVSKDISELLKTIAELPDQKATLKIERNGNQQDLSLVIGSKVSGGKKQGMLGTQFSFSSLPAVSFEKALIQGAKLTFSLLRGTFTGIKQAFVKRSVENFAGPIMMISLTVESAGHSLDLFLFLLAFISIGLAALNAIPLAILDGGHALIYTIEALTGKPLNEH